MARKLVSVMVAAVLMVAVAACGSNSGTDAPSTSAAAAENSVATGVTDTTAPPAATTSPAADTAAPTTTPQPTGEPIKLGLISPKDSTTLSYPDVEPVARIAEAAVNARGGVNGRPVEVVYCDDKDNADEAALCARKLLQDDKVMMIVASHTRQGAPVYPVLDAVDSICFGCAYAGPENGSDPRSYTWSSSAFATIVGEAVAYDPATTKKIIIVRTQTPTGEKLAQALGAKFDQNGTAHDDLAVDPAAVDYQPICQQVQDSGADTVALVISSTAIATMAQTCARLGIGGDKRWIMNSSQLDKPTIDAFITAKFPVLAVSDLALEGPRREQFDAELKKYSDVAAINDIYQTYVVNTWLAITLFAETANKMPAGDLTAASFRAYLDGQTKFETGMTTPIDFTTPPTWAGTYGPRVFNGSVYPAKLEDSTLVQTGDPLVVL